MRLLKISLFALVGICYGRSNTLAQEDSLTLAVGLYASYASQPYQPLWLVSNRYGLLPDTRGDVTVAVATKYYLKFKPFTLESGAALAGNFAAERYWPQELYAKIKFNTWQISAGRESYSVGEVDSLLSSGSLGISGNARPVPKVGVRSSGFIPIPIARWSWLQVKFSWMHGWMGQDRFVKGAYLHEKSLYLKIGPEKINLYGGIAHFAIWGGEHPRLGMLPHSFRDYIKVVLKQGGGADSPDSEALNKLGNHLGITDIGVQFKMQTWDFALYYQTPFEDHSSFGFFRNPDHLAGISIKNKHRLVSAITLEYMDTRDQSGPIHPPGLDNYYNNGLYSTGWVYQGQIIGAPLFLTRQRALLYSGNETIGERWNVVNNRIHGIHLGFSGHLNAHLYYRTLLTYTQNYGNYSRNSLFPPFKKQGYLLQELVYQQTHWKLMAALSADVGNLSKNIGALLGIQYDLGQVLSSEKTENVNRTSYSLK